MQIIEKMFYKGYVELFSLWKFYLIFKNEQYGFKVNILISIQICLIKLVIQYLETLPEALIVKSFEQPYCSSLTLR